MAIVSLATATSEEYLYFPELAKGVLAGDAQSFNKVLNLANETPPGESLEELAELSSRFVRISPIEFLTGQVVSTNCFGVNFMGSDYVDNPGARAKELQLRREALESVNNPELELTKQRCLAELAGS
jgi:hypothetical protein